MKYWINTENKGDKLIIISEDVIYNSNPSLDKLEEYRQELEKGSIPKAVTGTPFRYITRIETDTKTSRLTVHHGKKSKLDIVVHNPDVKREIFEYLKEDKKNNPQYRVAHLTWLQAGKKQLIILAIALAVILYAFEAAVEIHNGTQFKVSGVLISLVIGLAEVMGPLGVAIAGGLILSLLVYRLIKRLKGPTTEEQLVYY